jgi:hypothetical protein
MNEMRQLHLPAELCDVAEKKFGLTFASLEELLVFLLSDLVRDDASRFDQEEERLIENRLRDLGYL